MKRIAALLAASALMLALAACGDFAPDPTAFAGHGAGL